MIKYKELLNNRGTIVQYRNTSFCYPWSFPSNFLRGHSKSGIAPVLTVNLESQQRFLLAVSIEDIQEPYCPKITIGHTLKNSIQASQQWLREFRPIWLSKDSLTFYFAAVDSNTSSPPQHVDGASAGMSCILAGLSYLLQLPLSLNWAYSAAIDAQGTLYPVNAIEEKIALMMQTPHLRNLLLHQSQHAEFQQYCQKRQIPIHIFGANTIQEALEQIPIGQYENVISAIQTQMESLDIADLTNYLEHCFQSTLLGQNQMYAWGALHRSLSSLPSQTYQKLDTHTQLQKKFIQLISARYGGCTSNLLLDITDIQWLNSLKLGQKIPAFAHLLQQLITEPQCLSDEASSLFWDSVAPYLPKKFPLDSETLIAPPYLKLWGAWSRYLSSKYQKNQQLDQIEEIFLIQKQIFECWINNGIFSECSYPLCELIFLAKTQLPHHLAKTSELYQRLQKLPNGITIHNAPYIENVLQQPNRSPIDPKK